MIDLKIEKLKKLESGPANITFRYFQKLLVSLGSLKRPPKRPGTTNQPPKGTTSRQGQWKVWRGCLDLSVGMYFTKLSCFVVAFCCRLQGIFYFVWWCLWRFSQRRNRKKGHLEGILLQQKTQKKTKLLHNPKATNNPKRRRVTNLEAFGVFMCVFKTKQKIHKSKQQDATSQAKSTLLGKKAHKNKQTTHQKSTSHQANRIKTKQKAAGNTGDSGILNPGPGGCLHRNDAEHPQQAIGIARLLGLWRGREMVVVVLSMLLL